MITLRQKLQQFLITLYCLLEPKYKNTTFCFTKYIIKDWFIIDELLINKIPMSDNKLKGFKWVYYSLPKKFIQDLKKEI